MRGTGAAATAFIGFAILILAGYTIYMFTESMVSIYRSATINVERISRVELLGIVDTAIYMNGTICTVVENRGSQSIEDVRELEMVVTIDNSNSMYTFSLRSCPDTLPGCWIVERISVGNLVYSYEQHPYLRPGEKLYIRGQLPIELSTDSYIVVVVLTPRGSKAEYASTPRGD